MSRAELSSLSSSLDELLRRITDLADRRSHGGRPDEVANGLYEVERALREARRRLSRVAELAG